MFIDRSFFVTAKPLMSGNYHIEKDDVWNTLQLRKFLKLLSMHRRQTKTGRLSYGIQSMRNWRILKKYQPKEDQNLPGLGVSLLPVMIPLVSHLFRYGDFKFLKRG